MFQKLICRTFLSANIDNLLSAGKGVEHIALKQILKRKAPVSNKNKKEKKKYSENSQVFWIPA